MKHDLAVIGLGYIGLPMAAICARAGLRVLGVDIRPDIVDSVRAGIPHIAEPGLAGCLAAAVADGALKAAPAPEAADIYLIAVPTPVDAGGRPDMRMVHDAARAVARVAAPGDMIILQSTSPVGATRALAAVVDAARPDLAGRVDYAYCPERAIPGRTMQEMTANDRAVGGLTPQAASRAAAFYRRIATGALLETDAETAEMVKLAENAARDVQIAFANELSLVCAQMGLDARAIIALANRHPRVDILQPGPGVGGHCIPVDPWFIIDASRAHTPLMQAARAVNDAMPAHVIEEIRIKAAGMTDPVICLLGLAYKENTGDLRASPAIAVADALARDKIGRVLAVDPHARGETPYDMVPLAQGLEAADIVVLLTAHDEFKSITPAQLAGKAVIDTRGALQADG